MPRQDVCFGRILGSIGLVLVACGPRQEPARVEDHGLRLEASVDPAAPVVGVNHLELALRDGSGRPVEGAHVAVKVHMHAMGSMPPMGGPAAVRELGDGRYGADFELGMGGSWMLEIEAHAGRAGPLRAEGSLLVGTPGLRLEASGGGGATAENTAADARSGSGGEAAETGAAHPGEFAIPPERVQEIGVRSVTVERRALSRTVRALGTIGFDETALADVSLKVRGWVGSLRADAVGIRVERGEVLFTLYSPELYAAQEEYLQAVRSRDRARGSGAPDRADWRVRSARRRLELWDVAPGEVAALERRGEPAREMPIRSPASGYVVEKNVAQGSAVEPGARLLRIVPLDRVWVDAEVYESEAPLVREGMPATVELAYLPGRRFEGHVAYVYPTLSTHARTLRVRVELGNPDLVLRPGMWANVYLRADAGERLVVPESAVLRAGERSFVFLVLGEGRFRPRQVELGVESDEEVEVLSGLEPGQRVVASGTFLIAAESRLRAGLEQW
jgi:Cu(I)/Ag(I) efflux system membrane fusion protein